MSNRIESLRKDYESKILEADENIKLLLTNPVIIPEHTNINKVIDETEAELEKFKYSYTQYSDKLKNITEAYQKYEKDWNNNSAAIKNLLGQFEIKHENVKIKFKNKMKF